MDEKKDALVPLERPENPEDAPVDTPIEVEYRQARTYFKESAAQAVRTNAALLTVLGLFVIRGLRYAWEALRRYLPSGKGGAEK
jgi:hypothetical protein